MRYKNKQRNRVQKNKINLFNVLLHSKINFKIVAHNKKI